MTSEGERTIKVAESGEEPIKQDRPDLAADLLVAGRYRVLRMIGKGGMGEVMLARDEQVGREVAIKRMRAANPSERAIQRFLREASVQGRLEHPSIVPVHEIGRDSDRLPYFVMKRVTGTSLAKLLAGDRASYSQQRVLRALADVCLAIELAHKKGVVHRDLKPDNIMLGDFGEVYILDWGVAKVIGEDDGEFADVDSGSGEHATAAGTAIGTPGYMAPEQVRGAPDIDGRADIYTLGCLLFEILAGEPLHPRGRWEGLQSALGGLDARPSQRAPDRGIPPELDELCVHATALERAARIATARELGERIQRYLDGDRDLALRRELARGHLERARASFAAEGHDARAQAMRESAAALALDPQLAGAAELVGRLMLEPPRETPREVIDAIAADDLRAAKSIARAGTWAVFGAINFLPLVVWIAPPGSALALAVLAGVLACDAVIAEYAVRARVPRPGMIAVANTIVMIVVARLFSPTLIAPGIAAALAMAMLQTPRFSWLGSAVATGALMCGAVLLPLVAERLDLISRTLSVTDQGIVFHAAVVGTREGPTVLVSALYACALIITACMVGGSMRSRTRAALHRLQLQAWQLRQLVPG